MRNENGSRSLLFNRASALALAICAAGVGMATPAQAQQESTQSFSIPAGDLATALTQYGQQTGKALVYPAELARGKTTAGVSGRFTPREALDRLLGGTGLSFRTEGASTLVFEPNAQSGALGDEKVTSAVRVEGAQGSPYYGGVGQAAGVNGVNGSRDITATEGTKSFTSGALTVGSKVPQALKDVPQSISVLTTERLEQQNVTDFTSVMRQLPGVTVVQGSNSLTNSFYSRGFEITNIQVDGGAPLTTLSGTSSVDTQTFFPQIDMSIYDHVELLRGATGLLNGYGNPSGSVNLVRKKPLDHAQFQLDAQIGSWETYRIVADATAPLALDGKLRGRLVMTYQDNRYFYDVAKNNKTLIYGIAELDLTPTTLLTAGINYTKQQSVPWENGLPRYTNGGDLNLPVATCLCFGWNRWDFKTTELFAGLEQRIGQEWMLKVNVTRVQQASAKKVGYSTGSVNPTNGLGTRLSDTYSNYANKQLSTEAVLSGAFTVFGQRQEITIGASRAETDGGGTVNYLGGIQTFQNPYQPYPGGPIFCQGVGCPTGSIASNPPINVFAFDRNNLIYNEPPAGLPLNRTPVNGSTQYGAYLNLRLTAFDRLHLTTGVRWSKYESNQITENLCGVGVFACPGKQIGDVSLTGKSNYEGHDFSWPPRLTLAIQIST